MKLKSEKGYTGVDIAVSVIVIFIFITIISMLSYNMNSETRAIELKAQALELAVNNIENMKLIDYNQIEDLGEEQKDEYLGLNQNLPEGFTRKVYIEDYSHIKNDASILSGYVKKVTVEIKYKFKKEEHKVELSAVLSK